MESTRRTVLIAENDRMNLKVVTRMLKSSGYSVVVAGDGEKMLDRLERGGVDLVIADAELASAGGLDAALLCPWMGLGDPFVPIIGLTADASEDARKRFVAAGMTSCLCKPVRPSALIALVRDLLAERPPPTSDRRSPSEADADGSVRRISSHPRFAAVAAPVLNTAVLESLRELGGDAFVIEILEDFTAEIDELLRSLSREAACADAEAIRPIIHALRSSAANMGGTAICEMLGGWEHLTSRELRGFGRQRLADLVSEALKLRRALASFRDGLPAHPATRR